MDGCKKNREISSTRKVDEHFLLGFLLSRISLFKEIENKMMYTDVKIAWTSFANAEKSTQGRKINYKKTKMILLKTNTRNDIKMQKSTVFVKKSLKINMLKIKNATKSEILVII